MGRSEHADTVWSRGVVDGRFLTAEDIATTARVAVIGTRMAESLFGDANPIDEEILINAVPSFLIIFSEIMQQRPPLSKFRPICPFSSPPSRL